MPHMIYHHALIPRNTVTEFPRLESYEKNKGGKTYDPSAYYAGRAK